MVEEFINRLPGVMSIKSKTVICRFKIFTVHMHMYRCNGEMIERMKMDRRRLEHAHFRYAMLNVAEWYKGIAVKKILFTSDQSERTLLEFTPLYMKAFYENYSGKCILCIYVSTKLCMAAFIYRAQMLKDRMWKCIGN